MRPADGAGARQTCWEASMIGTCCERSEGVGVRSRRGERGWWDLAQGQTGKQNFDGGGKMPALNEQNDFLLAVDIDVLRDRSAGDRSSFTLTFI